MDSFGTFLLLEPLALFLGNHLRTHVFACFTRLIDPAAPGRSRKPKMALSYQRRFSRRLIEDVRPPGKLLLLGKFPQSLPTGQCFFFPTPETATPAPSFSDQEKWKPELVVLICYLFFSRRSY